MANLQDCSVGLKAESTYGTGVTVDRWHEFDDESFILEPHRVQGSGAVVGAPTDISGRRVTPTKDGKGDLSCELYSKGFGYLWSAALGAGVSTLVSGTTWQQNFTHSSAPSSYTIQKGLVRADGTVDPYTFLGCMVSGWEFNLSNAGLAMLKTSWDIRDLATATSYTAPTYASAPTVFNYSHGVTAAFAVGGTLTVPTTTALATGGTAVTNVRDFKLSYDKGLDDNRFTLGNAGLKSKPTAGKFKATGSFTAEYDSTTNRDAFLADTELSITLTLTTAVALSSGFEQFQIALPAVKLDKAVPVSNKGDLITVACDFTVLHNQVAAQPIYVVHRTSDSAL